MFKKCENDYCGRGLKQIKNNIMIIFIIVIIIILYIHYPPWHSFSLINSLELGLLM